MISITYRHHTGRSHIQYYTHVHAGVTASKKKGIYQVGIPAVVGSQAPVVGSRVAVEGSQAAVVDSRADVLDSRADVVVPAGDRLAQQVVAADRLAQQGVAVGTLVELMEGILKRERLTHK